jgi:FtsP/CotA-like multicopper oxidase with cupredoxin domain
MWTRRHLLTAGVLAPAVPRLTQTPTPIGVGVSTAPPTRPFIAPLPIPEVAEPVSGLSPEPDGSRFQHFSDYMPKRFYKMRVREFEHSFHPDLDKTSVWGYNDQSPGPTFHARYHEPIMVRIENDLPEDHRGFGIPEIITHLHNSHSGSESDGFPADFYGPGRYRDHHYCNDPAGADQAESLGTLWYHDHRLDFTAQNVYRGLAGFYLLFDDVDAGNEETGLRLPAGKYDIPLIFQDKVFDADSQLVFDVFNLDGILGDRFTVNGAIQPHLKVDRRKYRFRLLDGGPSRFYEFALSNKAPLVIIANDGNLLPAPVSRPYVRLGPAERIDVVIDFSNYQKGDQIYLVNRLAQTDGRKPDGRLTTPVPLLRFDIDGDAPDPSVVPDTLRYLHPLDISKAVNERVWILGRKNGAWTINDRFFDGDRPAATVPQNTTEIWTFRNESGGWAHPMHIHLEEFRIISRNGNPPPAWEQGRKDVVVLNPGETVQILIQFRDFVGRYPMHCHNTVHEDHAMMIRFDVVAAPTTLVAVPDVVNLEQAAAQNAITGAGLTVGAVSTAYHQSIAAGAVIDQAPAAGASVARGTSVNLVVSRGAEPKLAVTAPTHTVAPNSTLAAITVPVIVSWSGTAGASALVRYELQRSANGGLSYAAVTLPFPTATSFVAHLNPNSTQYRFRVRAVDASGAASAYATGPSFRLTPVQESASSIVYTGPWTPVTALYNAYGGSTRASTEAASATLAFTGNRVIWIAPKGLDKGLAEVWIDGSAVATVDLYANSGTTFRRAVFVSDLLATGAHTIEIRVLGTRQALSTGTRVDIDAFITFQ